MTQEIGELKAGIVAYVAQLLHRKDQRVLICLHNISKDWGTSMADRLASEKVVVSAPMSFHGSAARIWNITDGENATLKLFTIPAALLLICVAWCVVLCWYVAFGILLVPYRLIRRSSRKNKRDSLRHRELLSTIEKKG